MVRARMSTVAKALLSMRTTHAVDESAEMGILLDQALTGFGITIHGGPPVLGVPGGRRVRSVDGSCVEPDGPHSGLFCEGGRC